MDTSNDHNGEWSRKFKSEPNGIQTQSIYRIHNQLLLSKVNLVTVRMVCGDRYVNVKNPKHGDTSPKRAYETPATHVQFVGPEPHICICGSMWGPVWGFVMIGGNCSRWWKPDMYSKFFKPLMEMSASKYSRYCLIPYLSVDSIQKKSSKKIQKILKN